MKNKVLITGGTGLVGTAIRELLEKNNYETAVLSRNKHLDKIQSFYWNPETEEINPEALKFADYILHLAGENISTKRWTVKQKKKIYDSRILSTRFLYEQINQTGFYPKKIISASAIGYYGTETLDKTFYETDDPGKDFLANVVRDWETEILKFKQLKIPLLIYRLGVVFSDRGGALPELKKTIPYKFLISVGNGRQVLAWIALEDVARLFLLGLENSNLQGIYNVVSPFPLKLYEINNILSQKYKIKHLPFKIPSIIFKLIMGEKSSIILKGSKVSSEKIKNIGFKFSFPKFKDIL